MVYNKEDHMRELTIWEQEEFWCEMLLAARLYNQKEDRKTIKEELHKVYELQYEYEYLNDPPVLSDHDLGECSGDEYCRSCRYEIERANEPSEEEVRESYRHQIAGWNDTDDFPF